MDSSTDQKAHEQATAIIEGAAKRIERKLNVKRQKGEKLADFCERAVNIELNRNR